MDPTPAAPAASDGPTGYLTRVVADRWTPGLAVHGWTGIPNAALREVYRLEPRLTATELLLLLLVATWRRSADDHPFVKKGALARCLGLSTEGVKKALQSLKRKGYIRRSLSAENGYMVTDITPFIERLDRLPPRIRTSVPRSRRLPTTNTT
jgi:biotin operon repressor